ncbi:MAG TPA: hypothetical protein VGQ40_07910, partial [Chthoniobacterales bacterium]|nr:hypothetical protein [Chthoniobacterales bacterium]
MSIDIVRCCFPKTFEENRMESKSNKPGTSKEVSFGADENINKVASAAHNVVDRLEGAADQATRNIKPAVNGV